MPLARKHIRLAKYDYSQSNHYFVTTCTEDKKEWFGVIKNDKMILNQFGEICLHHLQKLPEHYDNLESDTFIIMPNHVHAIFIIDNSIREGRRPSPTYSLIDIMRGFKTFSSNQINKTIKSENKFKWQRSFYDHIIRSDESLNEIRQYIINNPKKLDMDEYNKS